jgi:hypothetical protein
METICSSVALLDIHFITTAVRNSNFTAYVRIFDRLCGLVVRVLEGSRVRFPGTTTKKSSGSGTGSTQPREYN